MTVPDLTLNDGKTIPQLGFGVFRVDPGQTEHIVSDAIEVGYRHIDTAALYHNEEGVGAAVRASGLPREEFFITTKLWHDRHRDAPRALEESLERLGLDYVDLYLIHWPHPSADAYADAWKSLIELREKGLTRSIGVSNFEPEHLDRIIAETGVTPAVNQVELHIDFQQPALRAYDAEHGIATEAWAPLGGGSVSDAPALLEVAKAHGVTPAQAILRWHLQVGNVVIPKSNHRERMAQNFDVFGFELTDVEMEALATIDRGEEGRNGSHPNNQ